MPLGGQAGYAFSDAGSDKKFRQFFGQLSHHKPQHEFSLQNPYKICTQPAHKSHPNKIYFESTGTGSFFEVESTGVFLAASVCSSTRDSHASTVMGKRKKVHGKEPTQEKPLTNFTPVSHLYKVMEGFCDGVSPPVKNPFPR